MQPYGIAKNVLIEFQDSLTLVGFMVMDIDPRQQKSIILGKPFLKLVKATINKKRRIINMNVDRVHEKFIYHPQEPQVLLTGFMRSLSTTPRTSSDVARFESTDTRARQG
jgi:hypothetical protein